MRQLFLWTGRELLLSRCTEQRWTWEILYIEPATGGTCWVSCPLRSETVGSTATAQGAIAMMVQHLPADCGPAVLGILEELAAQGRAGAVLVLSLPKGATVGRPPVWSLHVPLDGVFGRHVCKRCRGSGCGRP
ncbi:DUF6193 family natural product biosynthesis protein [Streptomyces microflavus]|uniref:DUF6193 family natural product biosynthesis protein n=1 Tax=Streptomyces microflavus TaxID=1919 RepID=UPI003426120D